MRNPNGICNIVHDNFVLSANAYYLCLSEHATDRLISCGGKINHRFDCRSLFGCVLSLTTVALFMYRKRIFLRSAAATHQIRGWVTVATMLRHRNDMQIGSQYKWLLYILFVTQNNSLLQPRIHGICAKVYASLYKYIWSWWKCLTCHKYGIYPTNPMLLTSRDRRKRPKST